MQRGFADGSQIADEAEGNGAKPAGQGDDDLARQIRTTSFPLFSFSAYRLPSVIAQIVI